MGTYVRDAGLIVIADTKRGGERQRDTVLVVGEVIKGDAQLAGQSLVLPRGPRSTADAWVPMGAKGVAVLLKAGWQEADRWPVLEAYQKPHELQALRTLVRVYAKPRERERLLALRETLAEGNPVYQEQMLADLRDMRDPANFSLITDLYEAVDPAYQVKLVDLIRQIGDPRGVPTLIRAMESPDRAVSGRAASALRWHFPGAPGVTEAFEKALEREHLARVAAQYLLKRRQDPALQPLATPKDSPWLRARRLRESGDEAAARAAYLGIIEDAEASAYTRRRSAEALLAAASEAERERIRKALLPLLSRDAETSNHLTLREAAGILRSLRHPECLPPLIRILKWNSSIHRKAACVATMGVRDLGAQARQSATARLTEWLAVPPPKQLTGRNPDRYLLELLWLGDAAALDTAEGLMHESYRRSWATLAPLRPLAGREDETAFLVSLVEQRPRLSREAWAWLVFRLGDLRQRDAIPALAAYLVGEGNWGLGSDIVEALVRIGGPAVEKEMLGLLSHPGGQRVRQPASEVLFRLQGARGLELARRMIIEDDLGARRLALLHLSKFGAPDDLPLLLPLCDYWKADRTLHYWAMMAASSIRDRCGYDVNGPIKPAPPKAPGVTRQRRVGSK
jgi:HEAT repeat protein